MTDVCRTCNNKFEHKCHAHRKRCDSCGRENMLGNTRGFKKGQEAWNKGMPAPWARWDALFDIEVRERAIKNAADANSKRRKELHPNWKGGKGTERKRLMGQKEYTLWRTAVFMRDDYTCQSCGEHGGTLQADHIKPWSLYPEIRYAIDNGRTLCVLCHRKTDTWGYRIYSKGGISLRQ